MNDLADYAKLIKEENKFKAFAEIRKQRRSFEEKLRRDLLSLENAGKAKESGQLIQHLESELYQKMGELTK